MHCEQSKNGIVYSLHFVSNYSFWWQSENLLNNYILTNFDCSWPNVCPDSVHRSRWYDYYLVTKMSSDHHDHNIFGKSTITNIFILYLYSFCDVPTQYNAIHTRTLDEKKITNETITQYHCKNMILYLLISNYLPRCTYVTK